jgi:hypothetical protein
MTLYIAILGAGVLAEMLIGHAKAYIRWRNNALPGVRLLGLFQTW